MYRNLPEYKELLQFKKLKKQKLQQMQAESGFVQHIGFKVNCTDPSNYLVFKELCKVVSRTSSIYINARLTFILCIGTILYIIVTDLKGVMIQ